MLTLIRALHQMLYERTLSMVPSPKGDCLDSFPHTHGDGGEAVGQPLCAQWAISWVQKQFVSVRNDHFLPQSSL